MIEAIAERDPEREQDEPTELPDYGFFFPLSYIRDVAWVLENSNFCMWPDAGGFNDQDAHLIQDLKTYFHLQQRLEWEYKEHRLRGKEERRRRFEDVMREE